MSSKIKNVDMLEKYIGLVPSIALEDVDKRMSDWFSMGGNIEDNYIKQQYRYLERYIEFENKINDCIE